MLDFLSQFLIRAAVMVPVMLIVTALLWLAFKRFGYVGTGAPFEARNMRTWPLSAVLADVALFAVTFAVVATVLGDGEWTSAAGGAIAAIVAVGLGPLLAARFVR